LHNRGVASRKATPPRIPRGEPISEQEIAFCHYLMGHDAQGKRRTMADCAKLAGLSLDQEEAEDLAKSARVRDYCATYAQELALQMARQDAMRRQDALLSPMAIAGELFYLLKFGKDERARVAAGAKLLDWMGPLDERMKSATIDELRYLAAHGHWPDEQRRLRPAPTQAPPAAATPEGPVTIEAPTLTRDEAFNF